MIFLTEEFLQEIIEVLEKPSKKRSKIIIQVLKGMLKRRKDDREIN